ncbi:MAG: hypothetical protein ABFD89_12575 [Bryobacteraceae bacterium]
MKTYRDLYRIARTQYTRHPEWYGQHGIAAVQLKAAKREARIREAWEKAEDAGLVRLRVEPDESTDLDNLLGDVFNPEANPDIDPKRLEQEKQHEIDRINRDGVWGVIGEYKAAVCPACGRGGNWEHADSCWGFIGNDWEGSGYDLDIMEETLAQLAQ